MTPDLFLYLLYPEFISLLGCWKVETGEYSELSEMLFGAEMINVLCYVDVRAVLFSKWELFVTSALALSKLWLCPILWAD